MIASTVACQAAERASSPTPAPASPTTGPTPPVSDVDLETFRLSGAEELLDHLGDTDWSIALVLRARPIELQRWAGDGHWHARTSYRSMGSRITVVQAGFEALPPGRLVRVRGTDGIVSDGNLYWLERGFTLSLAPGDGRIARRLRWVVLPTP